MTSIIVIEDKEYKIQNAVADLIKGLEIRIENQKEEKSKLLESIAKFIESFSLYYPEDIFTPPNPGEHGKTVDSCSANAIRTFIPHLAEEVRKLKTK